MTRRLGKRHGFSRSRLAGAAAMLVSVAVTLAGCAESGTATWDHAVPSPGRSGRPSAPPTEPVASHLLVFEVTGTGTVSSIICVVNGVETTVRSPMLPWKRSFELPAERRSTWTFVVHRESGATREVVLLNGRVLTQGAGSGSGGESVYEGSIEN